MRYFERDFIELEDSEGNTAEFEVEFKIEPVECEGLHVFYAGGFLIESVTFTTDCFFEGEERKKGDELKKFDADYLNDLLVDMGYEVPRKQYA